MATSKLQRRVSRYLSTHFSQYHIKENSRPEWCLGDDFERLELDLYIPELNTAFEIQGRQHYVYTPHFHASYDDFVLQQRRDAAKKRRCQDYGVALFEIDDDISFDLAVQSLRETERAYLIRERKFFSPDEWSRKIQGLEHRTQKIWRRRQAIDRAKLVGQVGGIKGKLQHIVDVYGMVVFSYAPEETSQSLFWHAQKLGFWVKKKV